MIRINIKPLSINKAFQGKRYKTKEYLNFEKVIYWMLPKLSIPDGRLKITFIFGINKMNDLDNPAKLLIDILQKRYNFNDNRIYELNITKIPVKIGAEFFEFKIEEI